MEKTDWKRIGWLTAATLVLGAIIGACAGLLTLLLYGVEYMMLGFIESEFIPGAFTVPAVRRIASVTLGLGVAGVIWYLLRTKTEKVPSVKKAVNGGRMPFWQTIVHVVLQIFIVGSGASIGREVVAVAAGAGLGGVYNAPLAGMFFAVEILLVDVTLEKVAFGLGMSATAAFVATAIKGEHMFYDIGAMQMNSTPSLMLFALLCGTACGVVGALFRKGSQWAESHKPTGWSLMWQMPLAGLVTGLVSIVVPQVMGNGRAAAQLGFSTFIPETADTSGAAQSAASAAASPWTFLAGSDGAPGSVVNAGTPLELNRLWMLLGVLALTFVAKAFVTLMTIRSGASGGVLQPGIALGSTLGTMLGLLWLFVFPVDSVTACALIGAAALLSASQQAPLMAMCLVMELTEAPIEFFVPVGMAVAVSVFVSSGLLHRLG